MHRSSLVLLGALTLFVLTACESDQPKERVSMTLGEPAQKLTLSPAEIRREGLRRMMLGLNYDTGRVTVDDAVASTIAERGNYEAARASYERGNRLLFEQNNRIEAIGAYTRAVLIWPEEAEFYAGLGRALNYKGKHQQAIASFRTGLDVEPASLELRELLADVLSRIAEFEEAVVEYRQILAQDPDYGPVHKRLAVLMYYMDQRDIAWEHVAAAAAAGTPVPPQLELLLADQMPQPQAAVLTAGPQVGPMVRVDDGGTAAANETTASASDGNPMNVITAWNDWRESDEFDEIIRVGASFSGDGGETWADFVVRPPASSQTDVEGDPMTCYDHRSGTLWVGGIAWASGSDAGMFVARRPPGSLWFQESTMAYVGSSFPDKGWMAAGPDPDDSEATRVYMAFNLGSIHSTDMGSTWSEPESLGSGIGYLPRVGPNGEYYIAYWDFNDGVMLKRSYDGGESFTTHTIATRMDVWDTQSGSRFPGTFRVPSMNYIAVDQNDGTLYCVYFDTTEWVGGNRNVDLYFTKSTDDGTSWTTPVIINQDGDPPGDQFWTWLEVDQWGRLHLMFFDSRHTDQDDDTTHGMFDAYYSASVDGGDTWAEYRLTFESFDSNDDGLDRFNQFLGDYNGLAVAGNRVYPCYLSTQNGDPDVFVNTIVWSALGDLNCDNELDLGDINPFVLALSNPAAYAEAYPNCDINNGDINEDGVVNFGDINPFVALLAGK
jgi:hypothetical protein